jgi:hypothetical protein
MVAGLKTVPSPVRVSSFLGGIADAQRRADCRTLVRLMKAATGAAPKMWGPSIIGFGSYRFRYASGRLGEWFLTGFAPRKNDLTLYIMPGFSAYSRLLARLGKHKTGRSCLHIKRLADVDLDVLDQLIGESVEHTRRAHG